MVRKLDRENQGGRFPAWLMNLVMPSYLDAEVRDGSAYIAERRGALEAQLAGAAAQVDG